MGATTTRARTFTCDRCMRDPHDDEPMNRGVLFALPRGWKWGQSPLSYSKPDCFCPDCLPVAEDFILARERWHAARNDVYSEANREAEAAADAKLDAWVAEHPEPVAEWAADTAALRQIMERENS